MQTLEGYYKAGGFHTLKRPVNVMDYCRVIITILDEPIKEKPDTWAELDRLIAATPDNIPFEDFPRGDFGRDTIYN